MVNYPVSSVNFKEPVIFDDQSQRFKPVDWRGWLLRLIPFYDVFQDRKIMDIILQNMSDKKRPLNERMQWAKAAKDFERNVLGKYFVSMPGARKEFSQEIYLATLEKLGLPREVAKKHPEFVKFIKVNHLDKMIRNQGHEIKVDEASQEPMLLLEGHWKIWSAIKESIKLTSRDLDIKEHGWSYLGASDFGKAGLVKYDSEKWEIRPGGTEPMPRPYCKLTPEQIAQLKDGAGRQIELPYIENYVDCRAEQLPERALENNDHSFKKMIDKNGNVYYFGFSPKEEKSIISIVCNALASNKAVIESPDHYADVPPVYRMSEIKQLTQQQFDDEFKFIKEMHNLGATYNAFNNNCIEMVIGADEYAKLPVPSNKELRVKFYKIFPKPLQYFFQWTPLPKVAKRWIARTAMLITGYDRGEKVGGITISAKAENSIWKDLKLSHPRCYLQYLKKQKADMNPMVFEHH